MLKKNVRGIFDLLHGSIMNADRAYDADANFELLYKLGVHPNIKQQRENAVSRILRHRKMTSKEFDVEIYHYRGLIEGIFGAEEKANHRLHCRYFFRQNQRRFATITATGWNVKVLNRLQCANRMGIPVLQYA